jgi:hypothetical protein
MNKNETKSQLIERITTTDEFRDDLGLAYKYHWSGIYDEIAVHAIREHDEKLKAAFCSIIHPTMISITGAIAIIEAVQKEKSDG